MQIYNYYVITNKMANLKLEHMNEHKRPIVTIGNVMREEAT